MLTSLPMLGLVTLVTVLVLVGDGAGGTAALTVVVTPIAAAAIAVPLICIGLVIGIRARSAQQVSGLTAGSLVVVSLAARFVSQLGDDPSPILAAVPLIGPAFVLRQTVEGNFDPRNWSLLCCRPGLGWLILRSASTLMGGEHLACGAPGRCRRASAPRGWSVA